MQILNEDQLNETLDLIQDLGLLVDANKDRQSSTFRDNIRETVSKLRAQVQRYYETHDRDFL